MEEEKVLTRGAIAGLWLLTIIVELSLLWTLLILNGLPAIYRGYWFMFWIWFAAWGIISFLWISLMALFISKNRRKKLVKRIEKEWR